MKTLIFLVSMALLAVSCQQTVQPEGIPGHGNVTYVELEGGFWGVVADDGQRFQPVEQLPDIFQVDGLDIYFEYVVADQTATIQQWGQPVKFTDIEIE